MPPNAFQRLNKLNHKEVSDSKPKDENPPESTSVLKQNSHLLSKINLLEKEIKDLRLDILSLLHLITDETTLTFTKQEAKQQYANFKSNSMHLINRISDKVDLKTGTISTDIT